LLYGVLVTDAFARIIFAKLENVSNFVTLIANTFKDGKNQTPLPNKAGTQDSTSNIAVTPLQATLSFN